MNIFKELKESFLASWNCCLRERIGQCLGIAIFTIVLFIIILGLIL